MNVIIALKIGIIFLGFLMAPSSQGEECFHVELPQGVKEIRVPSKLSLLRYQGQDTMTPAGFWMYRSGQNLALSGPAHFCLEQDIVRNVGFAALLGEPGGSGPLVELANGAIVFDLNGHALRSDRAGVAIEGYVGGKTHQTPARNFTFRNGIIDVSGSGISLTGWQYVGNRHTYRLGPVQIGRAISWYGPQFRKFDDTNILLENLTIKSGSLAAYLVGRNNIIRHCRIEVEGHEAIALFGANTQLIDNEIIVKRRLSPPKTDNSMPELGTYYAEYAAIWIRDAPGAIIRGNKITIEGFSNAKEAILLINSPDVVIENNDITGSDKLYTALDEQSSARARDNRKRFGKWPDTSARPISPGD